jgi:iron complex outermembrane recepter protein
MVRNLVVAAVAVWAASTSATAIAQTQAAPQTGEDEAAAVGSGDIVVTARKREESAQDVPIALTAFGAAAFESQQVVDLEDLNLGAPNLTIVRNTGTTTGAQVYIRGVGQDDSSFTNEPSIGIYLDDVYIGRQIGGVLDILDFERIEVLRGPQGTLYGRNSSGGAIKYVARRPDLDETRVSGSATYGSRDRFDIAVSASVPLIADRLAIKIDGGSRDQRGWLTLVDAAGVDTGRRANGVNSQAGRLSLLWQAGEATSVYAAVDIARNRSGPQAIVSTNCTGLIVPPTTAFTVVCPYRFSPRRSGFGAPDINRFKGFGANLTVEHDLGWATLRSVTGYREFSDDVAIDLSGNPAAPFNLVQFLDQDQFSQEFQLATDLDGIVNFTAGLFYFDEGIDQDATFTGFRNVDTQSAKSYAAYGEAYVRPTDALTITLGARISRDKKRIQRAFFNPATAPTPTVTLPPGDDSFADTVFTPKIGLDYKVNDDVLLYAAWSRGFRAGGFAAARPTSAAQVSGQFGSETADSYEAGVKTDLFNRLVRFNLTGFLAKYKGLQSSVLGGNGSFAIVTGDAKFYGLEVETTIRPTDGVTIYGNLGLLHDEWTRQPPNIPTAIRLKHAPRSHFKVGFDVNRPISERFNLLVAANYRWTDDIYRSTANHQNIRSPAYGLIDAQIGIAVDERWKLILSGQNLSNKIYWTQGVSTLGRYLGEPRSFALTVKASL